MSSNQQTTVRDKNAFGPGTGGRNWGKLRAFTAEVEEQCPRIPSSASTIFTEGVYRLDMQGAFATKEFSFYNLQVQEGSNTVFSVYVQATALNKGITEKMIYYRINQSAVHKTEHTTMSLDQHGSFQWEPLKPSECTRAFHNPPAPAPKRAPAHT